MTDYRAEFEGMPAGLRVDVNHEDYKKLVSLASEENLSQKAFSRLLQLEASRVQAAKPAGGEFSPPAPAPASAARPVPTNWDKMSTRERFAFGLNHGSTRSNRGQS
jgi:hypothetical protein